MRNTESRSAPLSIIDGCLCDLCPRPLRVPRRQRVAGGFSVGRGEECLARSGRPLAHHGSSQTVLSLAWFSDEDAVALDPPPSLALWDLHEPAEDDQPLRAIYAATKKKYKPVAIKVRPLKTQLPQQFRILRHITGDPLAGMPHIDYAHIPPFTPAGRYTQERADEFERRHRQDGFLNDEEVRLLHHFMVLFNDAFAWDDSERGAFKDEYFPPIEFPVVPHTPWVERNIPIPPGIWNEICDIVRQKMRTGVYEPSNATYRSPSGSSTVSSNSTRSPSSTLGSLPHRSILRSAWVAACAADSSTSTLGTTIARSLRTPAT